MSTITTFVDRLTAVMPRPVLTVVSGQPDYPRLRRLEEELAENAAAIHCNLGGGQLGYLGLVLDSTTYATLSSTPFQPPDVPSATVPTPEGSQTAAALQAARQKWEDARAVHREYVAVHGILRRQLLAAVDELYIAQLRQPYGAYSSVTVVAILQHLYANYAGIGPAELEANDARLTAPWDPNEPFETLIKRVDDCVAYAQRGGEKIDGSRLMRITYRLVSTTGLFAVDCRRWRERITVAPALATWPEFTKHFRTAHKAWCDSAKDAPSGYSAAALAPAQSETYTRPPSPWCPTSDTASQPPTTVYPDAEETSSAIASLAVATQADRTTIANLTSSIASLQADIRSRDAIIAQLRAELRQLRQSRRRGNRGNSPEPAHVPAHARAPAPAPANPDPPWPRLRKGHPNSHYCWTHGWWSDHPSSKCPNPSPNHNSRATRSDRMGGSERNRSNPPTS